MESTLNFSASETKLLLSVLQHNSATLNPDWDAVAAQCGYNAAATARASWSRVYRNKLSGGAGAGKPDESSPVGGVNKAAVTKKSPAKPKKVKAEGEEGSPKKTSPKKTKIAQGIEGAKGVQKGAKKNVEGGEDGLAMKSEIDATGTVSLPAGTEEELAVVPGEVFVKYEE